MVFLHNSQLLFIDCDYPRFSLYLTLPNAGFFLYLFNDFYVKAYKRRSSKAVLELPEMQNDEDKVPKTNKNGLVTCKKDISKESPNTVKKLNNNNNVSNRNQNGACNGKRPDSPNSKKWN